MSCESETSRWLKVAERLAVATFLVVIAASGLAFAAPPQSDSFDSVATSDGWLSLPVVAAVDRTINAEANSTAAEEAVDEPLPPLEEELLLHGGSYLYSPEGDQFGFDESQEHGHAQVLRLPENWQKPLPPLTGSQEFLGPDEIQPWCGLKWFGENGFQWEPRFVTHGSYQVFGQALELGNARQDGIGHNLVLDFDLRVTGTERAHVQFRPFGRRNTGGSFFQLNDPSRYVDNSTIAPDRWWVEGELYSVFSDWLGDEFTPFDYHVTLGKVPYAVHNSLLINDEVTGVIVTKNTLIVPPLSNLLVQGFYFFDDVNTATPNATDLAGLHATADWQHTFFEATLAYVSHSGSNAYDSRYAAISATQFFGPLTLASRALFKGGDSAGTGSGELYVIETNFTRAASSRIECATGIEKAVVYANFFNATRGWSPIAGANFNRLQSNFAVNPLVRIGQGFNPNDTIGVAAGVELFRHHDDEQFIPEVAYEQVQGTPAWAVGLRWLRKLGPRIYLDASGVLSWSSDRSLEREGILVSTFVLF
ncbi:hypothetical protein GC176_21560 [bacterium]|nr:hypothetical protein [bacterium]